MSGESGSENVVVLERGVVTPHGGIAVEKLLEDRAQGPLTVGIAVYEPGAKTGDQPVTHAGREFLVILEGIVTAEVGGEQYELHPGHSIAFLSSIPHRGWNSGMTTAKALFVNFGIPTSGEPA